MHNFILTCCFIGFIAVPIYLWAKPHPVELMLAKVADVPKLFQQHQVYWLSEKYDGVRAYWNGKQLLTRQGNVIHAPQWFTAHLPNQPLDGELWIARGQFEAISGIARRKHPDDDAWQSVRYMVFDLPQSILPFELRQQQLQELVKSADLTWLSAVKQLQVESLQQAQTIFKQIVRAGGEGVMLNRAHSYYYAGRSDRLLKMKPFLDDEATVIQHLTGKGRLYGQLGAVLVKNEDGKIFKIGSGFSDKERRTPPKIGSKITYRHSGYTNSGKPRFAVFLRLAGE